MWMNGRGDFMATRGASASERQIAVPDLQKSNRRVPLLHRGTTLPIIIATTLIGLASMHSTACPEYKPCEVTP
jgi:hypothetical protein